MKSQRFYEQDYWNRLDRYAILRVGDGELVFDLETGSAVVIESDEEATLVLGKMHSAGARIVSVEDIVRR